VALTAPAAWRLHAVLPRSRANGPGLRYVIWAQGCTLACPGCFNPETHSPAPAVSEMLATVESVTEAVLAEPAIEGVTLTGGEPLQQPEVTAAFCAGIKERSDLSIIILTGFTRNEIERDPVMMRAAGDADMIIAGRYNARVRLASGLRGSSNKEYWARTGRYRAADLAGVPEVEMIIGPDGALTITGTPGS
jgi:anaerobic ribonucleoside-triphosphate reductase activating protein